MADLTWENKIGGLVVNLGIGAISGALVAESFKNINFSYWGFLVAGAILIGAGMFFKYKKKEKKP